MKIVTPSVHIIGETTIVQGGLQSMLEEIGVPEWATDAGSDTEVIVEAAGKLCYMSFDTSLNDNLTRTGTRNNHDYIQEGLISTKHGSVLEHGVVNFAFINVSRVLTHELVRHRAGAAYSQTSGRYVRNGELSFWIPFIIDNDPVLRNLFIQAIVHQEYTLREMVKHTGIDDLITRSGFELKKELTSAFRRIVGNGVANNIMASYNHRAIRHLIAARTSRHAEEEVRIAFNSVFDQVHERYTAIYDDAIIEHVKGHNEITFRHEKV